jgi:hypothetical protein
VEGHCRCRGESAVQHADQSMWRLANGQAAAGAASEILHGQTDTPRVRRRCHATRLPIALAQLPCSECSSCILSTSEEKSGLECQTGRQCPSWQRSLEADCGPRAASRYSLNTLVHFKRASKCGNYPWLFGNFDRKYTHVLTCQGATLRMTRSTCGYLFFPETETSICHFN